MHTEFWCGELRRRDNLKDLCIYRRILLKQIFKTILGDVDWVDLATDREKLSALLNTVINLPVT